MTAPAVTLVVLSILAAGPSEALDISPAAAQVVNTTLFKVGLAAGGPARAQDADVIREPPAGSGAEFVRYASPPEFHNGILIGGLYAWTGVLIGALMFLERRRLASLLIGGGGLAVGLAMMLIG